MARSIVQRWKVPITTKMSKQNESTERAMKDNYVRMKMAMGNMAKVDDEHGKGG